MMFGKVLSAIGLVSAGLLLLVLNLTTPSTAGAGGILIVFLLGYITATTVIAFGVWAAIRLWSRVEMEMKWAHTKKAITLRRAYYYASVIALAPVIIVSLQSVGGVGLYELILIGLFVVLGCVYVAKRTQ